MSDKAFFDTNVLVYAFDKNEPEKGATAKKLILEYGSKGNLVISTQVLQELYVTFTGTGKLGLLKEEAETIVNNFSEYPVLQIDKTLISRAMKRHQGLGFSFWDNLIVEAALQSGSVFLFTEDMHDDMVIDSLTLHNPFSQDIQINRIGPS